MFEPQHAPIFFGRTAATSGVLAALRTREARGEGFVAVVGASGSGKSSLARAGVLPLLTTAGVLAHVALWRQAILLPGERYADLFRGLAAAVTQAEALPELLAGGRTIEDLATMFRDDAATFAVAIEGAVRQAAASSPRDPAVADLPAARLALVIDQMEQIFTLPEVTPDERARFVRCLAAAVRSKRLLVIATLRSDFFQRCHEIPELVALMQGDGQYQLQSPGAAELDRIITRPAALAGIDFEPGTESVLSLDERLRVAALEHPHSLPLLEFALEQLYQRRTPEGRLTHAAYDAMGELNGAVASHAEQAFLAWSQAQSSKPGGRAGDADAALADVFRSLVTLRTDTELVTARRVGEEELPAGPPRDLANALLGARLLVKDTDEAGHPLYAVAHEAVLREWPRAREWLARNLDFLRVRAHITADQQRWENSEPEQVEKRDPGFLIPPEGRRLAEAAELLRAHRAELDAGTVAYIDASMRRATRTTRRRQSSYAALTLLLIGTVFGIYAFRQSRQIDLQRGLAVAYRLASQAELTRVQEPRLSALLAMESLRRHAGVEADIALRRSLLLLPELLAERPIENVRAMSAGPVAHLVVYGRGEGLRVINTATGDTSRWLLRDMADSLALSETHVTNDGRRIVNLTQSPLPRNQLRVVDATTGAVNAVEVNDYFSRTALSSDGRWFAAMNNARIQTWDLTGPTPVAHRREMQWSGNVGRIRFSPDSHRVAVTAGFSVYAFDVTLDAEPRMMSLAFFVNDIAFRPPDAAEIAVAGAAEFCLWTVSSRSEPRCQPQDQGTNNVAFNGAGTRLALAGDSGVLRVLEMERLEQVSRFALSDGLASMVWNAGGTRVAARTTRGVVHVWNVDETRELARVSNQELILAFDSAGTLTTLSHVPSVQRWSLHEGRAEHRLLSHPQEVHDVVFMPDGRSVITGSGYAGEDETDDADNNVRVWSVDSAAKPLVIPRGQPVGAVRLTGNGRYLLTAGWRRMDVWDLQQQAATSEMPCTSDFDDLELTSLSFALSRDGRFIACHTEPQTVQVFSLPDGRAVGAPRTGDAPILGMALTDDGRTLALGREADIELWDSAGSGQPVRVAADAEGVMLHFLPRSRRLVVTSQEATRVFDVERNAWEDLRIAQTIRLPPVFSEDGTRIVMVGDTVIAVRDLANGRTLFTFTQPETTASVALSPDGLHLATATGVDAARVWEIASGRELVRLTDVSPAGADILRRVAFSQDGRFLATAHRWDVRLWLWRAEDLLAHACARVRGNLTAAEWSAYGGSGESCPLTCTAFPRCTAVPANWR